MATIKSQSRKAHILHVDDNRSDLMLIRLAFDRAGIAVDIADAQSAEHALRLLGADIYETAPIHPDIILLDLNLPQMSGVDFLSVVKSEPMLKHIPVLILTSSCADLDVTMCYDRHASGFIAKPNSLDEMQAVAASIDIYWFGLMQSPSGEGLPLRRPS